MLCWLYTVIANLKSTIKKYVKTENLTVQNRLKNDNSKLLAITNSKIKENNNYLKSLYKDNKTPLAFCQGGKEFFIS